MEFVKKLEGNDVYFLEVIGDKILVNDNYSGILVFDRELCLLETIEIMDDFIIESSVKRGQEILFICPENKSFVYFNLVGYHYKIIPMVGWEDWIFSPLFQWEGDKVLLSDYKGRLVQLDLEREEICEVIPSGKEGILQQRQKLNDFVVEKMFAEDRRAVVESEDGDLELIDYTEEICSIICLPKGDFHDFELQGASVTEIGEEFVLETNLETKECQEYAPEEGYYYLRGKYMAAGQQTFLFLLSSDMADDGMARIERHLL